MPLVCCQEQWVQVPSTKCDEYWECCLNRTTQANTNQITDTFQIDGYVFFSREYPTVQHVKHSAAETRSRSCPEFGRYSLGCPTLDPTLPCTRSHRPQSHPLTQPQLLSKLKTTHAQYKTHRTSRFLSFLTPFSFCFDHQWKLKARRIRNPSDQIFGLII